MTDKPKSRRVQRRAPVACSASKHAAMKHDGWKNCWHCGIELNVKPNETLHAPTGARSAEGR